MQRVSPSLAFSFIFAPLSRNNSTISIESIPAQIAVYSAVVPSLSFL